MSKASRFADVVKNMTDARPVLRIPGAQGANKEAARVADDGSISILPDRYTPAEAKQLADWILDVVDPAK